MIPLRYLVFGFLTLVFFGFITFAWIALTSFQRWQRTFSPFKAVFLDENGYVKDERAIKRLYMGGGYKWKEGSSNPTKAKFRCSNRGIGKSEEMTWTEGDYLELPRENRRGKIVLFGLQGLNKRFALVIKNLNNQLYEVSSRFAEERHKRMEAENKARELQEEFNKNLKAQQPVFAIKGKK